MSDINVVPLRRLAPMTVESDGRILIDRALLTSVVGLLADLVEGRVHDGPHTTGDALLACNVHLAFALCDLIEGKS